MHFKNIKLRMLALSAATLFALTSCGGNQPADDFSKEQSSVVSAETSTEQSAVKDVPAEIGLSIKNSGSYTIDKEIKGTVVVETEGELTLTLKNAVIEGTTGPAIYVKNCGGLKIVLEGESTLSDSAEYSIEQGELKGALFSEDDITISGEGSLLVTGNRSHAIASDDGIVMESGNVTVESAVKDGLHANDLVEIKGGALTVKAASGDAIESEAVINVSGGNVDLSSTGDSIKASLNEKGEPSVTVSGGNVKINTKEDGIQSDGTLLVTGGTIDITTTGVVSSNNNGDQQMPGWQGGTNPTRPDGSTRPQRPDGNNRFPGFTPDTSTDETFPQGGGLIALDPNGNMQTTEQSTSTASDSSKGIKATGTLTVKGGTIKISSTDDAVHSNADLYVEGGTFNISADDDAFHADGALAVKGGNITVTKCYEGFEGKTVTVDDGVVDIVASDDGMNSTSGSASNNRPGNANAENSIVINGGSIHIRSSGDCVDSNGTLTVNGGTLCVECQSRGGNNAIDADGTRLVNGGVLVALGGSDMLENPAASSKQPVAVIFATVNAGSTVALTDSEGNVILCYTAEKAATTVTVSAPALKVGESYTVYTGVTPVGESSCGGLYYGDGVSFTGGTAVKTFTQSSTVTQAR